MARRARLIGAPPPSRNLSVNLRAFDVAEAAERVRAACGAIDRSRADVVLVGRCEAFLMDRPDLDATIARLKAYDDAGADCLHAPGIKDLLSIARLVGASPSTRT